MVDKTLEQIRNAMDQRLKEKESILIAIDGRCASGKTTLAAQLHEQTDCDVIHMDDFFFARSSAHRSGWPGRGKMWTGSGF